MCRSYSSFLTYSYNSLYQTGSTYQHQEGVRADQESTSGEWHQGAAVPVAAGGDAPGPPAAEGHHPPAKDLPREPESGPHLAVCTDIVAGQV